MIPETTPGRVLRDLQHAKAAMRKARETLRLARASDQDSAPALRLGWETLCAAHQVLASIPWKAADDTVMTKQASVQRYATSLLVRLRRLARGVPEPSDAVEDLDLDEA